MSETNEAPGDVESTVEDLWSDAFDRSLFNDVDDDVREEIRVAWREIVRAGFAASAAERERLRDVLLRVAQSRYLPACKCAQVPGGPCLKCAVAAELRSSERCPACQDQPVPGYVDTACGGPCNTCNGTGFVASGALSSGQGGEPASG